MHASVFIPSLRELRKVHVPVVVSLIDAGERTRRDNSVTIITA
jgi:hypothetical protein